MRIGSSYNGFSIRWTEDKTKICFAVLIIVTLWGLLHIFTLSWGLPNPEAFEPDAIPSRPGIDAGDMMDICLYNYPPLQYLIVDKLSNIFLSPGANEIASSSARICFFRFMSALMALGVSLLIFMICRIFLKISIFASIVASSAFLMNPVTIFYSHTSNMDVPYLFWFVLCIFSVLSAVFLRLPNRIAMWLHVLAGIFLGCSFCTKDMIYAWCILPAVFYFIIRLKESRRILGALTPFLLWGSGFLITVLIIYAAAGGKEVFLKHFNVITGDLPMGFAQVGTEVIDRLYLFIIQGRDTLKSIDLPSVLMLIFSVFCLFAYRRTISTEKFKTVKYFSIILALMFLSENIFYVQITRSYYPRFAIPFIFLLCIFIFLIWEYLSHLNKTIFILLLCCQGLVAVQYLHGMCYDPRVQVRDFFLSNQLNNRTLAVDGAVIGRQYEVTNNKVIPIEAMRSWALSSFGWIDEKQKTIMLSPFDITMVSPEFLVTSADLPEKKLMLLKRNNYQLLKRFDSVNPILFSLNPYRSDSKCIYVRTTKEDVYDEEFPEFSGFVFARQLMLLTNYALAEAPTPRQVELLGKVLAPFSSADMDKYIIRGNAVIFAFYVYETAGRIQDASALGVHLLKHSKDKMLVRRALLFFLEHPDEAAKNSLSVVRDGNKVLWDFIR